MTVESHRIYETSVVSNGSRRIAHTNRRRLISAPPGGGGGKPIAAHIVKIGSFTEKPVRRLASTNGGGMAPLGALRSSIAHGGGGSVELSKMVIVKRLASSASPPASAPSKRGSIALQSGTLRESPSAESPCEQQNRFVDSPHGSLTHSELDDYIIDEILSLEDDQMALRDVGGTKTQPLPVSYSCADNLTTLSSPHHASSIPNGRSIPGTASSGGSGHSGSPIGSIPINSSSYRQVVSSSAPTSSMDMETLVRGSSQEISNEPDFYRDRRKKDIHNMIERRRRYNINDRIKELGLMLPKHSAEEMKLNKGTILKASCDYIRQLQKDRELMLRQQQQQARLEHAARIYAERVKELEEQLQKNGLAVPPASTSLPPVPPPPIPSTVRAIKQEPFDDIPPSPSQTPTGSLSSAGFMSQLSDTTAAMAITSPVTLHGQQDSNSFFSIGSCSPPESSPYATPDWRHSNISSLPPQQQPFSDLIMEDLSSLHTGGPLLQGDPMISAAGGGPSPHGSALPNQMSPDVQWDQASFSPDNQPNQSAALGVYQQQSGMDFS
uniref:BHLH domain-containing protein n=1 Tax=Parascaris univalens TaxID=6257 RepID=A0A915A4G5_PARUN